METRIDSDLWGSVPGCDVHPELEEGCDRCLDVANRRANPLLTDLERLALRMTGELWAALTEVVGHGPPRDDDLRELGHHLHAIQNALLAQSAARSCPDYGRLLGETNRPG